MRGNARNGNPEPPFPAKENLPPTIEPGLKNDLVEEGLLDQLPGKKHRVEHSALGQAKPQAAVKTSSFIPAKNGLCFPQRLKRGKKG